MGELLVQKVLSGRRVTMPEDFKEGESVILTRTGKSVTIMKAKVVAESES